MRREGPEPSGAVVAHVPAVGSDRRSGSHRGLRWQRPQPSRLPPALRQARCEALRRGSTCRRRADPRFRGCTAAFALRNPREARKHSCDIRLDSISQCTLSHAWRQAEVAARPRVCHGRLAACRRCLRRTGFACALAVNRFWNRRRQCPPRSEMMTETRKSSWRGRPSLPLPSIDVEPKRPGRVRQGRGATVFVSTLDRRGPTMRIAHL